MVTTLSPKVSDTPSKPIPTCGKPAAMTALPHPANVSQNVPINSAAYFLASMGASQICSLSPGKVAKKLQTPEPGLFTGRFRSTHVTITWPKSASRLASRVDIGTFVCYVRALEVQVQAFCRPFSLNRIQSD